jgi:hypothetical protein
MHPRPHVRTRVLHSLTNPRLQSHRNTLSMYASGRGVDRRLSPLYTPLLPLPAPASLTATSPSSFCAATLQRPSCSPRRQRRAIPLRRCPKTTRSCASSLTSMCCEPIVWQVNLAGMYEVGKGVPQDTMKAINFYRFPNSLRCTAHDA